jgi:hypothetical protein
MSAIVKFNPFAASLKASMSKMNAVLAEMDKKVNTFADEVLSIVTDYDSDFFANSADAEQDREDMKQSIINLFAMFQPEKKASKISGYIVYCQEERSNIKARNPELTPTQITSALGSQWKALDDEERAAYNEKAKGLKPMTDDEKAAKKSASKKALKEKKEENKKPVKVAEAGEKKEMKSTSKKTESKPVKVDKAGEKKEMKSTSKKTESKPAKGAEAGEKPVKGSESVKKSPKASPKGVESDIFSGPAKPLSENVEYWKCKKINLDENTEGRRWKYHPETGLCFENDDTYTLVARYVNDELTWLNNMPERIVKWAVKCGCTTPKEEEEDIELEGEFSDEE